MNNHELYKQGLYVSMNSRINKEYGIDYDELDILLETMADEWTEVDYEDIKIGDQIRYIRSNDEANDKFVAGGYVRVIEDDYLMYLSGNIHSLQKDDIKQIWTRPGRITKNPSPKDANIITFNKPATTGKYEVVINNIVVYRSSDIYKVNRFKATKKYNRAINEPFKIQ